MFIFFLATLLLIVRWRHVPGDPGQENSPLEEAQMALEPKLETFWSKQRRKIKVSARTSQLTRKGSVQRSFIDNKIISAEEQSLKLKLIVIFWTWMVRITFFFIKLKPETACWTILSAAMYKLNCLSFLWHAASEDEKIMKIKNNCRVNYLSNSVFTKQWELGNFQGSREPVSKSPMMLSFPVLINLASMTLFFVLVVVCFNDSFVCVGVGIAKAIFLLFWTFSFPSILTAASKSPHNRSRQKIKIGRWTPILVERYLTWCSYQCTVWDVRFLISTEVSRESGRLITMFLLIFHLWQIMNILRLSHSGGNATLVHVLPPN